MKSFELFIKKDKVSLDDWQELLKKVGKYNRCFTIELIFEGGAIEFFIWSPKDLSSLISGLEGFILKPAERNLPKEPTRFSKKIKVRFSPQKSILDLKEAEEIKKQRTIERVRIQVKKLFLSAVVFKVEIFLRGQQKESFYSSYYCLVSPFSNLELDFRNNLKISKKSLPLFLEIEETAKLFASSNQEGFLEIFGFPHFLRPVYFPLEKFDFGKHTLTVGQTGVGKSKLLELMIKNMAKLPLKNEYTIVIIDPHGSLSSQFLNFGSAVNFDFIHSACELFPAFSEPKIATELMTLLFKTLLQDQFNAKLERVFKYASFILFLKNQMSLISLKRFLTELEFRREILKFAQESEFDYLIHFFETEFPELQTKFYEIAFMPILTLIDELNFIPAISGNFPASPLEKALKENFLVSFSLNRIFLGEKATRLIAGLIIQQLFLIAQKRLLGKKIILVVDEVSLVENESLINILSEARKFDLSLFLSQQYLTQISPGLLKGILSNVYNYFVFKVSDEDAKILAKNLEIVFPGEILTAEKKKGISEEDLKRNLLVTLNPRECLVRIFADGQFYPCFKAKTMKVENQRSAVIYEYERAKS